MRVTGSAIVCAMATAMLAASASAHDKGARTEYVISAVVDASPVEGLVIQTANTLAPQLLVENRSRSAIEILDDDGRAFLRILPDRVEGDFNAAAFYPTYSTAGLSTPAAARNASAPPKWETLRNEPFWGWYDPRISESSAGEPSASDLEKARHSDGAVTIGRWSAPILVDGEEKTIEGRFELTATLPARPAPSLTSAVPQGWSARIVPGALPALMLAREADSDGPVDLVVLGLDDEPYIRFDRAGVEINTASRTWRDYGRSSGLAAEAAPEGDGPRWRRVAPGARYAFIEPRLSPPAGDKRSSEKTYAWRVPILVDGEPEELAGETRWAASSR